MTWRLLAKSNEARAEMEWNDEPALSIDLALS